jgi:phosphoribosylglycinamide formyltransferase 2
LLNLGLEKNQGFNKMIKKFLLLGSGELGKEFTISAKRYGQKVIAVDSYENAPAMQVADDFEVINMLDGEALQGIVDKHQPDYIIPEIEAIRTEKLYEFEKAGIQLVPSAKATNYTMDRKAIRDLAAKKLKLRTAEYSYAKSLSEMQAAVDQVGIPCVVKPLMSSSGKGQSVIRNKAEIQQAWEFAQAGSRGDLAEVIVEAFIAFESEITLLTVTQKEGPTLFCPPIGHRQERGDYQESWQPAQLPANWLKEAQEMAEKVTGELSGQGIWGVEFFIAKDGVYFSELSPRPHDTGMVTLAGTQNFNEFELHLRAILELPIPAIQQLRHGANAVVLASEKSDSAPQFSGLEEICNDPNTDFRIFGKPSSRAYRRMGICMASGDLNTDVNALRRKAVEMADQIKLI